VTSGTVASGQIGWLHFSSGAVVSGAINDAAVNSGNIASGAIGRFHLASGAIVSGQVGSGSIQGQAAGAVFNIASGSIGGNDIGSGAIQSGHLGSGTVVTYARNVFIDSLPAGQPISGVIAVCLNSGGGNIVPAERGSGLRIPAIGVSIDNVLSGAICRFVRYGIVYTPNSGTVASGWAGQGSYLYLGSGGQLLNLSGFMGGASSGPGPGVLSGTLVQRIGIPMSGAIFVNPEFVPQSGLNSGLLGVY